MARLFQPCSGRIYTNFHFAAKPEHSTNICGTNTILDFILQGIEPARLKCYAQKYIWPAKGKPCLPVPLLPCLCFIFKSVTVSLIPICQRSKYISRNHWEQCIRFQVLSCWKQSVDLCSFLTNLESVPQITQIQS